MSSGALGVGLCRPPRRADGEASIAGRRSGCALSHGRSGPWVDEICDGVGSRRTQIRSRRTIYGPPCAPVAALPVRGSSRSSAHLHADGRDLRRPFGRAAGRGKRSWVCHAQGRRRRARPIGNSFNGPRDLQGWRRLRQVAQRSSPRAMAVAVWAKRLRVRPGGQGVERFAGFDANRRSGRHWVGSST